VPDIPDGAITLAMAARAHALADLPDPMVLSERELARIMLEAAKPAMACAILAPLAERHRRTEAAWGTFRAAFCGTCWTRHARPVWPCPELLAIAEIFAEAE